MPNHIIPKVSPIGKSVPIPTIEKNLVNRKEDSFLNSIILKHWTLVSIFKKNFIHLKGVLLLFSVFCQIIMSVKSKFKNNSNFRLLNFFLRRPLQMSEKLSWNLHHKIRNINQKNEETIFFFLTIKSPS